MRTLIVLRNLCVISINALNAARLQFDAKCIPSPQKSRLDCIKSTFAPCRRVLQQGIKRAGYIAKMHKPTINQYPAYELTDDQKHLTVHWFYGDQIPQKIIILFQENSEKLKILIQC